MGRAWWERRKALRDVDGGGQGQITQRFIGLLSKHEPCLENFLWVQPNTLIKAEAEATTSGCCYLSFHSAAVEDFPTTHMPIGAKVTPPNAPGDTRICISFWLLSNASRQSLEITLIILSPMLFSFSSSSPSQRAIFSPWHPSPRHREKSSLTAVLLHSDINTMKKISANFYELSHHKQLINSCERTDVGLPLGEPLAGGLCNSSTLAIKEGPLLETGTSSPIGSPLWCLLALILCFLAWPRLGRQHRAGQYTPWSLGQLWCEWFRLVGNSIKIQSKQVATALCSHYSPSLKSGLGLCA